MYPLAKDLPTEASAMFKTMGAEMREGVSQVLSPSLACAFANSQIDTSSRPRGGQSDDCWGMATFDSNCLQKG